MAIVLIGTLDTKGREVGYVRQLLAALQRPTILIDAGSQGSPEIAPDIDRVTVFEAAGVSRTALAKIGDRGQAVEAAARGVSNIIVDLWTKGDVDGVLAVGGSAGTTIGRAAMRALPFGVPKLMVSTLASGQVRHFVGVRDILMMHSVVDISGLNRISRNVLTHAAFAMAGMVRAKSAYSRPQAPGKQDQALVAASMFGV